jgi:hypothetical protein
VSEISSQQIRSWNGVLLVNKFCRFLGKRVLFWKKISKENLTNFAKFLENFQNFVSIFYIKKLKKKTLFPIAFVSSDGLK